MLAYARSRVDDAGLEDWVLSESIDGLLAAGKIEEAAEARARLSGVWLNRGHRDRALEQLELARELLADREPSPAKAFVLQELARALMMQFIEHLQTDVSHGVRLLRNGRGDHAFLDPLQSVRIGVHRDDGAAFYAVVTEHSRNFFAGKRLKTDEGVDVFFLVIRQILRGGIEGDARITLHIHNVGELDLRRSFERVLVTMQALFEVWLRGHSEDDHSTFTLELLG